LRRIKLKYMAIVYYPKNQIMARRDTISASYEELTLASTPNTILYFDTASNISPLSASTVFLTSSYSTFSETSTSSSYATTASHVVNVSSYEIITTGSDGGTWVTVSFNSSEQQLNISTAQLFNFTCSSTFPGAGKKADITIFINNTATATSSLAFPSTWRAMGGWPTALSSSRVAYLWLQARDANTVVGSWNPEL
jgi:hypothetical protein